ncbi:transcriptional regulator, GntR family [Granulicella pectinivorans]|uniref:Transcriptional regulator, GntR family n=1 Tax=Granulicella pectinivorans TaxID=474950 RepID=A0A1I6MQ17_9BACT|nr:GntR family transcriptional regulator [Granulicella pectinivorans]SFS17717.1 transcriptional regulator, GntR family [Granulicella pectinivorans]
MKKRQGREAKKVTPAVTKRGDGFVPLDKNSFEPLYFQMQKQMEQKIRSGKLAVHDPLPGEAELSRIFGVSRMTSRQALQGLTADGFAYRERGRGTFVCAAKVEKHIAHLLGFSAEMKLLGLKASSRVLASATVSASPQIAASLQVDPQAPLTMLHRLRLANGEPIAIEQVWVPQTRFPEIDKVDFAKASLYDTLRDRYGVRIGSANETIEARGATKAEAALLGVALRASLLVVSRTLLDGDGHPVELAHSMYRGDRYRAVLTIPATGMDAKEKVNLPRDRVKVRRSKTLA